MKSPGVAVMLFLVAGLSFLDVSCNGSDEKAQAISLNKNFIEDLSRLPATFLPQELSQTTPVFERAFTSSMHQPMTVRRLYPDGRIYLYHNNRGATGYQWELSQTVPKEAFGEAWALLNGLLPAQDFPYRENGKYLREVVRVDLNGKRGVLCFYQGDKGSVVLEKLELVLLSGRK